MGLAATSKPVPNILFECLKQPCAVNTYNFSEQIAEICNRADNLVNEVSKELVGQALSNISMMEHYLPFIDLIVKGDSCTTYFTHIYVSIHFSMNDN